jgi:acyl dehydratase
LAALFLEDYRVGDVFETPARTVTEADVAAFAGLSGDFNPLHTDEEFAKTTIYGQRIAHGLLGLAIVTGLKQRLGISEGSVIAFLGLTWDFLRPLRIGDTVRARLRIAEVRPSRKPGRGVVRQEVELVNQAGEVIQKGEHAVMVRCRPSGPEAAGAGVSL